MSGRRGILTSIYKEHLSIDVKRERQQSTPDNSLEQEHESAYYMTPLIISSERGKTKMYGERSQNGVYLEGYNILTKAQGRHLVTASVLCLDLGAGYTRACPNWSRKWKRISNPRISDFSVLSITLF